MEHGPTHIGLVPTRIGLPGTETAYGARLLASTANNGMFSTYDKYATPIRTEAPPVSVRVGVPTTSAYDSGAASYGLSVGMPVDLMNDVFSNELNAVVDNINLLEPEHRPPSNPPVNPSSFSSGAPAYGLSVATSGTSGLPVDPSNPPINPHSFPAQQQGINDETFNPNMFLRDANSPAPTESDPYSATLSSQPLAPHERTGDHGGSDHGGSSTTASQPVSSLPVVPFYQGGSEMGSPTPLYLGSPTPLPLTRPITEQHHHHPTAHTQPSTSYDRKRQTLLKKLSSGMDIPERGSPSVVDAKLLGNLAPLASLSAPAPSGPPPLSVASRLESASGRASTPMLASMTFPQAATRTDLKSSSSSSSSSSVIAKSPTTRHPSRFNMLISPSSTPHTLTPPSSGTRPRIQPPPRRPTIATPQVQSPSLASVGPNPAPTPPTSLAVQLFLQSPEVKDVKSLRDFPESPEVKDVKSLREFPESLEVKDVKSLREFPESLEVKDVKSLRDFSKVSQQQEESNASMENRKRKLPVRDDDPTISKIHKKANVDPLSLPKKPTSAMPTVPKEAKTESSSPSKAASSASSASSESSPSKAASSASSASSESSPSKAASSASSASSASKDLKADSVDSVDALIKASVPKESQESKDPKKSKEAKKSQDPKKSKEAQDSKDSKEVKDAQIQKVEGRPIDKESKDSLKKDSLESPLEEVMSRKSPEGMSRKPRAVDKAPITAPTTAPTFTSPLGICDPSPPVIPTSHEDTKHIRCSSGSITHNNVEGKAKENPPEFGCTEFKFRPKSAQLLWCEIPEEEEHPIQTDGFDLETREVICRTKLRRTDDGRLQVETAVNKWTLLFTVPVTYLESTAQYQERFPTCPKGVCVPHSQRLWNDTGYVHWDDLPRDHNFWRLPSMVAPPPWATPLDTTSKKAPLDTSKKANCSFRVMLQMHNIWTMEDWESPLPAEGKSPTRNIFHSCYLAIFSTRELQAEEKLVLEHPDSYWCPDVDQYTLSDFNSTRPSHLVLSPEECRFSVALERLICNQLAENNNEIQEIQETRRELRAVPNAPQWTLDALFSKLHPLMLRLLDQYVPGPLGHRSPEQLFKILACKLDRGTDRTWGFSKTQGTFSLPQVQLR